MTAALDFCFGALAPLADELVCAKLVEIDGIFTGDLAQPPLVGEARASWLNDYSRATGADHRVLDDADPADLYPELRAVRMPLGRVRDAGSHPGSRAGLCQHR